MRRLRPQAATVSCSCRISQEPAVRTVDPRSLGAFVGMSSRSSKGAMLRAVVEGLDYQFVEMVRTLHVDLHIPFDQLIVVGGATRNKFWMQNKADMIAGLFGRSVEVSDVAEATSLGAAMLAGIGVGIYRDEEDAFAHVHKAGAVCEPDPQAASLYAQLFPIYQQLYPALKSVHHQLSAVRN